MSVETDIEYCPVSGQVVFRDPKWQHCQISERYHVDFCFIGRRILLITHHGDAQDQNVERLYTLREQFLAETFARFGSAERIVEMRDYGDIVGLPSKQTRVKQTQMFYDHRHQVLGVIVFRISLMVRALIRMGLSLTSSPFPFVIERDYSSAVRKALEWIEQSRNEHQLLVTEAKEWTRNWGEFGIEVGQIGNRILLTRPRGWMRIHHVDVVADHYRKMRAHLFTKGEPYIQIADYSELKGTDIGVRLKLAKVYNRLNQETNAPLALILIGTSSVMKTVFSALQRWIGRVNHCRNLSEAISVGEEILNDDKGRINLTLARDSRDRLGVNIQEMIEYVASFSWDEAQKHTPVIQPDHPFRGLYDALELVRYDLEELLNRNREAKHELAEKEAYYRGLYEMTAEAIILFDGGSGAPIDANPAALGLLGCRDLAQFLSVSWWRFLAREESDQASFRAAVQNVLGKKVLRTDWTLKSLNNRIFSADFQFSAISGRGVPVIMAVFRDMSEQRRVEEEIRRARDAAQKANEAKNEFLANMSHEVRTPLNGILGLTEILLEEERDSQRMEHLKDIQRSGESLLEIVSEILDFSRIETGRIQVDRMEFDVVGLVRRVVRMFSVKCHEKELEMLCDFDPEAVGSCVGDPVKIRQILVNLIGNAVKFTHHGYIMLTVRFYREGEDKPGLRFVVRDTGIGIPEDEVAKVFDRFYQVDSSMSRSQGGTGLGLSICKRLVTAMGGTISLSSKVGEGSCFEVDFPVDTMNIASQRISRDCGNQLVLLFEEQPMARMIMVDHLSRLGQRVLEAASEDEFFKQLEDEYAVLDGIVISMGHDDSLLERFALKLEDIRGDVKPVLLLSHGRSMKLKDRQKALGINETLLKPVFPNELSDWLISIKEKGRPEEKSQEKKTAAIHKAEPLRILLAEDNEINQKMICRLLSKKGWEVKVARDGQEAVNVFFADGADVVLMDLQMPVMDGFQAAQIIRSAEKKNGGRVPIVALTAHAQNSHMEKSYASGMDAYLTKPISTQALYGLLDRLQSEMMPKKDRSGGSVA